MSKKDCKCNEIVTYNQCLDEINPEVVYMIIPAEWACVYQKLLVAVADFGEQMLYDCQASCKDNNKTIINCWHMFASAVAAYQLGKTKLAETLIKYIKAQLKQIYKNSHCTEFDSMIPLPITPDGKLKALVGCGSTTKFYVDSETGELYEEYLEENKTSDSYDIEDDNLKFSEKYGK